MGLFSIFKNEALEPLIDKEILRSYNTEREKGIFSNLSYKKCRKYLLSKGKKETFHDSGNISIRFSKDISNKEVDVTFMQGPNDQILIYTVEAEKSMQDTLDLMSKHTSMDLSKYK